MKDWLIPMSAALVVALVAVPIAYLIAAPFWKWANSGMKNGRGLRYQVAKARVEYWANKPEHVRAVNHQIPIQIDTLVALLQVGMAVSEGFGLKSQHDVFREMTEKLQERADEAKHPFKEELS